MASEAISELYASSVKIVSSCDEHSDLLGPHKGSLLAAIRELLTALKSAATPINDIADMLNDVADAYDEILNNDTLGASAGASQASGISAGHGGGGNSTGGSFLGRLFGGASSGAGGNATQFDGLPTGQLRNGDAVVKGNNFEQFLSDYYSEGSSFDSFGDRVVVETASPAMIEGVHLGTTEVKDPGVFWGMHASSKEFFVETASHIPEVQAALDSGKSLSDIKEDPVIGTCASIYFDPANIPRVEKTGGYYTFDGDGRHRILAARELGYSIPVRVVGVRTFK